MRVAWRLALTLAVVLVGGTGGARAAYPGGNGAIAWSVFQAGGASRVAGFAAVQTPAATLANCDRSSSPLPCVFGAPSYSPDGATVAVSRRIPSNALNGAGGVNALMLIGADGGDERMLPLQTRDDRHPAFLPGGKLLVFEGRTVSSTRPNLFTVTTSGVGLSQLTFRGASEPAPCANGQIVFVRAGNIYLLGADRRFARQLTFGGGVDPSCAPDSARVAFVRRGDLYTIGTDGTGLEHVISGPAPVTAPTYSPDGRELAFLRRHGARVALDVASLNGQLVQPSREVAVSGFAAGVDWQPVTRIVTASPVKGSPFPTGASADASSLSFDPGGRLLAAGNADGSVSVFSVTGPAPRLTRVAGSPITTASHAPVTVAFSPNGSLLAAAGNDGNVTLFGVQRSPVAVRPVTTASVAVGAQTSAREAFSPHGSLLAIAGGGGSVSVFSVAPSSGALTPVSGSPFSAAPHAVIVDLAFSPTGALLATADGVPSVSVFSVDPSNGALSPLQGSPFDVSAPYVTGVAFRSRELLALSGTAVFSLGLSPRAIRERAGSPFFPLSAPGPGPVALGPSDRTIAAVDAAGGEGRVWLASLEPPAGWLPAAGGPLATGPGSGPAALAFSPNGALLATGAHGHVALLSVARSRG
jgi:WD40 repeat protein